MAELFQRVDVERVPRWPMLSRLFALSVVLHGLFIVAVIYVPQVRGIFLVAGQLSGLEFVSEEYDRSLIGQRATIVNLREGPYEKLYYPTDYFGAPVDPAMMLSPNDPMLVQQAAPPPPPIMRTPRRVRTTAPEPTPEPEATPTPETAEATPDPNASPTPADAEQQSEAELDRIAKANNIERPPRINTKPFEDIAARGKQLLDEGKLNLNGAVGVTGTAERNEDGTLKRETVKLVWEQATDETLAALAQEFINAISESRVLGALKGVKDVRMSIKLDQQNISIKITTVAESGARAEQMATGYGVLLLTARKAKEGTELGELYNRLKVNSEGSDFIITLDMPRDAAGKMIADMLAKKAAAAQSKS